MVSIIPKPYFLSLARSHVAFRQMKSTTNLLLEYILLLPKTLESHRSDGVLQVCHLQAILLLITFVGIEVCRSLWREMSQSLYGNL